MPEISRFYGIVIKMFVNDHNPPHLPNTATTKPWSRSRGFLYLPVVCHRAFSGW